MEDNSIAHRLVLTGGGTSNKIVTTNYIYHPTLENKIMLKTDIIVVIGGGLGNKLHTLYSSYYLAMLHGIHFKYYWCNDFDSGCRFDHIFDAPFIDVVDKLDMENRVRLEGDERLTRNHLDKKVIWMTPFRALFEDDEPNLDWDLAHKKLPLQNDIVSIINSIDAQPSLIGVHVRGGDIKRRSSIPIEDPRVYIKPEQFFPHIDRYLSLNSSQHFLLSCEDQEDEEIFLQRYGKSMFLKLEPCVYNRSTKQGVIDAFVNIILLSQCDTIIGMNSSFSGLASKINNKPKMFVLR